MTLTRETDEALSREVCAYVENVMASQKPFGDPTYIQGQLQTCMSLRLQCLTQDISSAADLLDAVANTPSTTTYKLFADPVLRCAVLHAHEQIASGIPHGLPLADCSSIFATAAAYLRGGGNDTPLQDGSLLALAESDQLGWVWTDKHSDDLYGRAFRDLVRERYGAIPSTPSDEALTRLAAGASLLYELLPKLAPSALQHARVISLVPQEGSFTGVGSSSQYHVGGVIFLNEKLGSPWWVAEHLLHEALHQKFYDFRQAHSLTQFKESADEVERPVLSPWNPSRLVGSNWWNPMRDFAAFHVYVHLALLCTVAEDRRAELESSYGPHDMLDSQRPRERARYLGEQLRSVCWDTLDTAGYAYADWLDALLDVLDPNPPPAGSTLHLYLDLYRKETALLHRAALETPEGWAPHDEHLAELARRELATARTLLTDLGADDELRRFDTATAGFPTTTNVAASYAEIRRHVEASLFTVSIDGYRLDEFRKYDAVIEELVGETSDKLYALSNGIPMPVAEAKRRAVKCGFNKSSQDGVGQLLAVLAGNLPQNAKVLELGTGVGVGIAWMVHGLGARTDVRIISAEVDHTLGDSAASFEWPPYVDLRIADGAEVMAEHGPFDLIFADAPPLKFYEIEPIFDSLRPGGMLIVDDMGPKAQAKNPEDTRIARLRQAIVQHPGLVTADVDWSTGMILGTRRP